MIKIVVSLAWRNLFRNKRRTIFTLLAVIIGFWSSLSLSALARGLSKNAIDGALYTLTGHGQIHAVGFLDDPSIDHRFSLDAKLIDIIKNNPNISHWGERLRVPSFVMSERESAGVQLVGIVPKQEQRLSFISDTVVEGRYLQDKNDKGIIVGKALLKKLKTKLGRRLVVMSDHATDRNAERGMRIVGVFDAELESTEKAFIFTGLHTAQQLVGAPEELTEISFRVYNDNLVSSVIDNLSEKLPELDVQPWQVLEPLFVAISKMQNGFLLLWFFIVVTAISFGLINTLLMTVFERKKELGLLQALGMRPRWVVLLVSIESTLLLVFGAVLGNLAALFTVHFFSSGIDISKFAQGAEMIRVASIVVPYIKTDDWIIANIVIVGIGTLGSFYPAWRGVKGIPLDAVTRT